MRVLILLAILPVAIVEIVVASFEVALRILSGGLAIVRVWFFRGYDYRRWLKRDLADCESILELGCGSNSPILQIGYGDKTDAVDIWQPYVTKHKRNKSYRRCWRRDIMAMDIPANAYDAVVICDVLEHLSRAEVIDSDLFGKIEGCARKKVIIFTPNGFIENDEVDGDPYQAHISQWKPGDYEKRGYKVVGATGLIYLFGKASLPKYRPYSVCAIVGMLTKPLVYLYPKLAWHSYAVKELE